MVLRVNFDEEDITTPDLESEAVRSSSDPWEIVGQLMVRVAKLEKQFKEGFQEVHSLNLRLRRIEAMLYGTTGTIILAALQYIAAKFGLHLGPGAP